MSDITRQIDELRDFREKVKELRIRANKRCPVCRKNWATCGHAVDPEKMRDE